MTFKKPGIRLALALTVITLLGSGCAATRSTLDITAPAARTTAAKGQFVKLVAVNDKRIFEAAPRNPSTPSLQNAAEISDIKITSRAVARKRGGYGNAMADILLPEGHTVTQLVSDALKTALTERGYTVVDEKSPNFASASPVSADISQFWSWLTPGMMKMTLEFQAIITIRNDDVFLDKETVVRGYTKSSSFAATDGEWTKTMQQGVLDLISQIKAKLR